MAIAIDATSSSGAQVGVTSITLAHTCSASIANRGLVVAVLAQGGTSTSGVTYNSVAMTQAPNSPQSFDGSNALSLWYLLNPSSGANNIVASFSGSTTGFVDGVSYRNFATSSVTDTSNTGDGGVSTTVSVTTATDNDWTVIAGGTISGHTISASTNTTSRVGNATRLFMGDRGPLTPAGSFSMTCSTDGAGTTEAKYIMVAFKVAIQSATLSETSTSTDTAVKTLGRTLTESMSTSDTVSKYKVGNLSKHSSTFTNFSKS